jgi:hypothetical protein
MMFFFILFSLIQMTQLQLNAARQQCVRFNAATGGHELVTLFAIVFGAWRLESFAFHVTVPPILPPSFVQQHAQANPSHESLATAAVMGQSVSGARVYDDINNNLHLMQCHAFLLHLCSCLKDFEAGGHSEGGGMAMNPVVLRIVPLEVRYIIYVLLSCYHVNFVMPCCNCIVPNASCLLPSQL